MGVARRAALASAALVALALVAPVLTQPPAPAPTSSAPPHLASATEEGELLSADAAASAKDATTAASLTGKATGAASLFGNVYVGDVRVGWSGRAHDATWQGRRVARRMRGHQKKGGALALSFPPDHHPRDLLSLSVPHMPLSPLSFLQATYYGDAGASGSCAFNYANVQNEAWARGTAYRVAMNGPQFFGSEVCGMCLKFRGLGPGAGANPVGRAIRFVLTSNQCPECLAGSIDQEISGDGRWRAGWTPVQCAVGSAPFVYSFQGSNAWFIKLQVANTRVPVRTAHWYARGGWWPMARTTDNYFRLQSPDGVAWTYPSRVRLVSIFGDVVYDTVALSKPVGRVRGAVQFPERAGVESVPLGGTGAATAEVAEDGGGSDGGGFAAAAAGGRRDEGAAPIRGGRAGEGLPAGLGFTLTSAEAAADAAAAAAAAEGEDAVAGVTEIWPHGLNAWPPGWGGVGGSGAKDTEPPQLGVPAPGHPSPAPPPPPASHPPWEAGWWPGPQGPVFPPPPPEKGGGLSNASAPGRLGSGPATSPACLGGLETGEQCGGRGGFCGGGPACADAPWPGLCCLDPGARCVRFDAIWWGCRASPFPPNSGVEVL